MAITLPADNAPSYTYTQPIRDAIAQVNWHTAAFTNVRTYGALGDGSTDDLTAINAAITACPVGGVVLFPPGDYRISAPINPGALGKTGITLRGTHSTMWPHRFDNNAPEFNTPMCRIRTTAGFVGGALLELQGRVDNTQTPVGSWTIEDLEL